MKILIGMLIMAAANTAMGEQWREIVSSSQSQNFIDAASITRQANMAEYWDKVVFSSPQKTSSGLMFLRLSTLGVINCTERTISSKYYAIYDERGKVLDFVRGPGDYRLVSTGTKGARIVDFVCAAKSARSLIASNARGLSNSLATVFQMPLAPGSGIRRYDHLIERAAESNHLEKALLQAVISVESGARSNAISPAGAFGLMQLMPQTAKRFGVTDVFDPAQNIEAGAKYLSYLLRLFGNDKELTLAAYNAGEGAVIKHGRRIPPYLETQQYVPKVMDLYHRLAGSR